MKSKNNKESKKKKKKNYQNQGPEMRILKSKDSTVGITIP
jgi:hypothetical protein